METIRRQIDAASREGDKRESVTGISYTIASPSSKISLSFSISHTQHKIERERTRDRNYTLFWFPESYTSILKRRPFKSPLTELQFEEELSLVRWLSLARSCASFYRERKWGRLVFKIRLPENYLDFEEYPKNQKVWVWGKYSTPH